MRHRVVAVIVMLALGLFAVPLASDAQQAGKLLGSVIYRPLPRSLVHACGLSARSGAARLG